MVGKSAFVLFALMAVVTAQGNLRAYLNTMDFAEEQIQGLASRATEFNSRAHHAEKRAASEEHSGIHDKEAELKALHASAASALSEINFVEAAQDNNDNSYHSVTNSNGDIAATEAKKADVEKKQEEDQKAIQEGNKWKVVSSNWRDVSKKDDKKDSAMNEIQADIDEMLLQEGDEYERGIDFTKNVKETNIVPNEANRPAPQNPAASYEKNLSKPLAKRPEYGCEICMMVMGRKIADSDELCKGLEHDDDRAICWDVVRSLVGYDRFTVDWLYHSGCLRKTSKNKWMETIPCPPHVMCSWMMWTNNSVERPFCQFFVTKYKRSEDFHKRHRLPLQEEAADKAEEEQKKEASKAAADDAAEEKNATPTEANTTAPGGAPESLDGMIPDAGM